MARPAPGAERSVDVLELLAAYPEERFTLSEVARRCELNKATAHALLTALSDRGVLLRHPIEKRYSLGPALVGIGDAARRGYQAADFVAPALDDLARMTGLWVRAWRVEGDHAGVIAEAGRPSTLPLGGPVRLPLIPPVGALWMAYADPATVEAWLARAPRSEGVTEATTAMRCIRRDGYVVVRSNPEWRALIGGVARPATTSLAEASALRHALAEATREPLLVGDLDASPTVIPSEIAAPVFGRDGTVDLALSATMCIDSPMSPGRVRELAAEMVEVAAELTHLAGAAPPG